MANKSFGQPDQILMSHEQLKQFQKVFQEPPDLKATRNMVRALYNMKLISEKMALDTRWPKEQK